MSLSDRRPALLPVLALAVLTAACGGPTDEGTAAAVDTIPVAATDDACDVAASELEAGTHRSR